MNCLDCKYASWDKTSGGRLSRTGDGRCNWRFPIINVPSAYYFIGGYPRPSGGIINRRKLPENCLAWEVAEAKDPEVLAI